MIQKDKLAVDKSNLQAKINELLDIAKKGTQKAQLAFNSMVSQEKALETENVTLKATIEEIKELNKANAEIEKLKEEKRILEENMEKAAAETKAKEEADKVAEVKLMNAFSLTKVAFKTGSMQLTSASQQRLDVAVNTMKKYEGYSYKVQGHTDNRGKEAFNLSLSSKRAESVKIYLVSKGIDENILSAEGFGSSQPISSNNTKQGREENRRVVFQIIY
jgi:outer membrane protein OmpA-like peptidoglycan-associated protein